MRTPTRTNRNRAGRAAMRMRKSYNNKFFYQERRQDELRSLIPSRKRPCNMSSSHSGTTEQGRTTQSSDRHAKYTRCLVQHALPMPLVAHLGQLICTMFVPRHHENSPRHARQSKVTCTRTLQTDLRPLEERERRNQIQAKSKKARLQMILRLTFDHHLDEGW